jgi:hypothetical protein
MLKFLNTWNPKFELYFSDQNNRPVLVQILKKNYDGDVFNLVGTDNPVEVIWDSDDDIYSPIRGSRCKLNLLITDFSEFDDFYKTDEREYRVDIYYYNSAGDVYEELELRPDLVKINYDAEFGKALFWEPYWSGFIVVDRWQEAMTTTPYEVTLEAIDGLGTIEGFDAPSPFKNNFFETATEFLDPTKTLFYYVSEILKKTGHRFDLKIANDIRKFDSSTDTISDKFSLTEQSTIFHDITINDIPLYNQNLDFRNCKEVLEFILRLTNSRIFQSYGCWYIISNSNLIDNTIDQQTVCPSGADSLIDDNASITFGEEQDIVLPVYAPDLLINGRTTANTDGLFHFFVSNLGSDLVSGTWTLPDGSTQTDNRRVPKISFTPLLSYNNQTISFTGINSTGSDTDTKTLTIGTPPTPQPGAIGGVFTLLVLKSNTSNIIVFPVKQQIQYTASQVGDPFSFDILLRPFTFYADYTFTSLDQVSAVCRFTKGEFSTEVHTTTKAFLGSDIKITVSGTIPTFPQTNYLHLGGSPNEKQFTTTVNITNNTSNTTIDKTQLVFSGLKNSSFAGNVKLTATGTREFARASDVSGLISGNYSPPDGIIVSDSFFSSSLLLQNINPDYEYKDYTIGVDGRIGSEDQTVTLVLSGGPGGSTVQASSAQFFPGGPAKVDANAGSLRIRVIHSGRVTISQSSDWLQLNQSSPTSFTSYGFLKTFTFTASGATSNDFNATWKANKNRPAGRGATIFAKDDQGNVLDSLIITQEFSSTDDYNSPLTYLYR